MHFRTMIAAIALASLQTLAHAELNLAVPKDAVPASAGQPGSANRFNLDQEDVPYGYQTTDKCPSGTEVTGLHYIGGKQYYKCDRAPRNAIPAVRDAERYQSAPSACMPGTMDPRCSNLPQRPY